MTESEHGGRSVKLSLHPSYVPKEPERNKRLALKLFCGSPHHVKSQVILSGARTKGILM